MKDKLIKLAKEKGFVSDIIGKSVDSKYSKKDFYYLWMCELQQWLEKQHNILITTVVYQEELSFKSWFYEIIISNIDHIIQLNEEQLSRKEALEEGLYESLKLI